MRPSLSEIHVNAEAFWDAPRTEKEDFSVLKTLFCFHFKQYLTMAKYLVVNWMGKLKNVQIFPSTISMVKY